MLCQTHNNYFYDLCKEDITGDKKQPINFENKQIDSQWTNFSKRMKIISKRNMKHTIITTCAKKILLKIKLAY